MEQRETIKSKKRIVIKVGTTTITHKETGRKCNKAGVRSSRTGTNDDDV